MSEPDTGPPVKRFTCFVPSNTGRSDRLDTDNDGYEKVQYTFLWRPGPRDQMYYGVCRTFPGTPPDWFCTVTQDFGERGHRDVFTSLFVSRDWGKPSDWFWLQKLWDHLDMEGPFAVGDLLSERIQWCWPADTQKGETFRIPAGEPKVYRCSFDDMIAHLSSGVLCSHPTPAYKTDIV